MLDKSNTNQGYLCGRLFAVLDKIQVDANGGSSIRERYMNAASATPASVFATILNLSSHHMEKLSNQGKKIFFEKMKQEIMDKIPATGFLHILIFKTRVDSLLDTTIRNKSSLRRKRKKIKIKILTIKI